MHTRTQKVNLMPSRRVETVVNSPLLQGRNINLPYPIIEISYLLLLCAYTLAIVAQISFVADNSPIHRLYNSRASKARVYGMRIRVLLLQTALSHVPPCVHCTHGTVSFTCISPKMSLLIGDVWQEMSSEMTACS
jgi:hypothetical protein